ncbi:MAG TPA: tryptophan--tRNA ligase [Candidatus Methylomirabilis sp.]|nr:tryptophan--tRNA ligase [Candidatus Methylomirabilis sp.]
MNTKKTIFSGIQPSGNLHLGNYLGAIKQWVEMQNDYNCIFCVVDYHAITVPQDPKILSEKVIEVAKIYLASGIDPKKSIIFRQSDIKEHTELAWILNCTSARMSDLENMTQYKDKAAKQANVGVGLFDYPVLMAADILLYDTDVVPVGEDQIQHVELARDLAKRFNNQFGPTFKIPEYKIRKESARIMGLDDPTKKMSKSAPSENNYIALTDDPDKAAQKIMRAITDSGSEIKLDWASKPGISNLLTIYSLLTDKKISEIEAEFAGRGYGEFKAKLAEIVKNFLTNFQKKSKVISNNKVCDILEKGARKLQKQAQKKIETVKTKLGI